MHDFAGGGVERMRLVLFKALAERGICVSAIVSKLAGPLVGQISPETHVLTLGSRRTATDILPLIRLLRRRQFDIIVSNLDHNNVALLLARMLAGPGTPVVVSQHNALSAEARRNWRYRLVPWCYRLLWRYADAILAVSDGVAEDLSKVASIRRSAITIVHNPVVTSDFAERAKGEAPHPWLADPVIPVFVFVGRLTFQKDPETLLRAMAKRLQLAPARLIFVGSGELQGSLAALAKDLGIEGAVAFAGFQARMLPWIRHADALVLSSRFEGFGNVLVEALACGTQVIATNCPFGPAEILCDGIFGQLAPVEDPDGLARAMARLLPRGVGAEARKTRAADFSEEACTEHHLALFQRIVARGHEAATGIFGLRVTWLNAAACATLILTSRAGNVPRLMTTPNIDHVRLLRLQAFAQAYASASLICIDGFPLAIYARLRGIRFAGRVTGCDIFHRIANSPELLAHRLFLVVESEATALATRRWLQERGLAAHARVEVAATDLLHDMQAQRALADIIKQQRPTLLVMTLGAPVSEIFVHTNQPRLPGCWALCVGQALRVELGLASRAPVLFQRLGLEWAWRLAHEPRRLALRYGLAAAWFPVAIMRDLLTSNAAAKPPQDQVASAASESRH